MALETLSSNEILNFLMYDTVFASKFDCNDSSDTTMLLETSLKPPQLCGASVINSSRMQRCPPVGPEAVGKRRNPSMQGQKKRRRRQNVCKKKEEAETQRMTHIAVERNRRNLMNEHLAVLRFLMPESYVQRITKFYWTMLKCIIIRYKRQSSGHRIMAKHTGYGTDLIPE
ncbi:hypothetical protein RHMOL_Rhmol11G0058600 [Rhododendron molle]|uniref:Uncharacterized protein n=1 Tax=Rhododendron molle TaxID=49168 RepID=A0ACC0LNZ3_RHOML|nr:hypothetical protein RHMOL_Rhmol11G0058600 [Rhododendron molle]